jgi:hypothetical protein
MMELRPRKVVVKEEVENAMLHQQTFGINTDDIMIQRRQQYLRKLKLHKQERNMMPASLTIPFCGRCNHLTATTTTASTTVATP